MCRSLALVLREAHRQRTREGRAGGEAGGAAAARGPSNPNYRLLIESTRSVSGNGVAASSASTLRPSHVISSSRTTAEMPADSQQHYRSMLAGRESGEGGTHSGEGGEFVRSNSNLAAAPGGMTGGSFMRPGARTRSTNRRASIDDW